MFTARLELAGEARPSDLRRQVLTGAVLTLNLVLAFAPAVVACLALFGFLR